LIHDHGFEPEPPAQACAPWEDITSDVLARLCEAGVSIWLDDLSRRRLVDGSLSRLVRDRHVVGVTTNPTIFAHAFEGSDSYDDQIADLALRRVGVEEALRALTTFDVRWACDVLRPVYEASGGMDGRVSIEADPRLAHDTARTVAEARALWWLVDRPNLFVKIPAARQGPKAISARPEPRPPRHCARAAATAVGVHERDGPGLRRHPVRDGPDRPRRGQHHAGGDAETLRGRPG
jgi:hypothetical protein